MNKKCDKNEKIYFELQFYDFSTDAHTIMGTYCINEKELKSIDAETICDYMIINKNKFFNDFYNVEKIKIFHGINGSFIRISSPAHYIGTYVISNIRKL